MKDLNEMTNSELLSTLMLHRDNLLLIKRRTLDEKDDFIIDSLNKLFDEEEKEYNYYLTEVFRRMEGHKRWHVKNALLMKIHIVKYVK